MCKRIYMKKSFLGLVMLGLFYMASAQEKGIRFLEENKPWNEVLAMSATENKLVFLDCYTTWCGPCKAMAKDVFPLPEVGDFMNAHFINVKQDMEKGQGIDLNKKYKQYIPGYPTYLLLNAKGEVVHQVAGYNAADKFIAKIKDGLEQRSWIALTSRYKAGERNWDFIWTYLQTLEDAYQKGQVKQVTDEVLPKLTLPLITADTSAYRIFRKYWTDATDPMVAGIISSPAVYRKHKDAEKDIKEWGGRLYKKVVDSVVRCSMESPKQYDKAKAEKLTDELRSLNVNGRANMVALMLMSGAVVKKDGNAFVNLYRSATGFGLLEYEQSKVSAWVKYLAEQTRDAALLKQYFSCLRVPADNALASPAEMRVYAYMLERMGDKAKAKEYYSKADKIEADFKEKMKAFMK